MGLHQFSQKGGFTTEAWRTRRKVVLAIAHFKVVILRPVFGQRISRKSIGFLAASWHFGQNSLAKEPAQREESETSLEVLPQKKGSG